jgi:hypothetical protein
MFVKGKENEYGLIGMLNHLPSTHRSCGAGRFLAWYDTPIIQPNISHLRRHPTVQHVVSEEFETKHKFSSVLFEGGGPGLTK